MNSLKRFGLLAGVLATIAVSGSVRAQETWTVTNYYPYGYNNGMNGAPQITGPWLLNVSRTPGTPANFYTYAYCVDRYSNIYLTSTETTQATTDPVGTDTTGFTDPSSGHLSNAAFTAQQNSVGDPNNAGGGWLTQSNAAAKWGEVAYIYDHYGYAAAQSGLFSNMAIATQLAIFDVLGELGPSTAHGDANMDFGSEDNNVAQFTTWYGNDIAQDYKKILDGSRNQSDTAYYIARQPYGENNQGQALIANYVPEGSSLLMLAFGAVPVIGVWRRRR